MKKNKTYIIVFAIGLIIFVAAEYLKPKELDWTMTFAKDDQIPFGTKIMHEILNQQLGDNNLKDNNISIYEFFSTNNPKNTNFIFINYKFELEDTELSKLIEYVKNGNNVFVASAIFSANVQDSLNFKTFFKYYGTDTLILRFLNPEFAKDRYIYPKAFEQNYFTNFDSTKSTILAMDSQDYVNFIKIKIGDGYFFISTNPLAFTNYNLLVDKNYEFAFRTTSYLNKSITYWDEYFKIKDKTADSPLKIILKNPPLKAAYYLTLLGIFIYILFIGKRKQRIIPIIKPPVNMSLEFAELIARLYLHNKNHKDIVMKRYKYLLEFLRTKYNIIHNENIDYYVNTIVQKTGAEHKLIKDMFNIIAYIEKQNNISEELFFKINNIFDDFYKIINKFVKSK